MITDEDVVDCFRMYLEELNSKVNLWMKDSKKYGVSTITIPSQTNSATSEEAVQVRVYQDDYVYLLDVVNDSGEWKVVGFCKPDGVMTRMEIEMVRLHNMLENLRNNESTDPYFSDCVSHLACSLAELEESHRIYSRAFCWMQV